MKKTVFAAAGLAAALALSACGQPSGSQSSQPASSTPAAFPALGGAPYAASYEMHMGQANRAMRMMRAGKSQRIENDSGGGKTGVIVIEGDTGRVLSFQTGAGAPKAALLIDRSKMGPMAQMDFDSAAKGAVPPKRIGADTVAGIGCDVWEFQSNAADGETKATQACVTGDGILLRTQEVGAADPSLIATKVDRGAQDPALFTVPAGYEVVDMSECTNAMTAMMEAMKRGEKPDTSKMAKCQSLAGKMSGLAGGE
jgi:predicted regulator of Ras-like GTPase activity (Roadblock/LC7/MglB family)